MRRIERNGDDPTHSGPDVLPDAGIVQPWTVARNGRWRQPGTILLTSPDYSSLDRKAREFRNALWPNLMAGNEPRPREIHARVGHYFTQTRQLDVIEQNKRKTLTTWLESSYETDSLVFYKDGYTSQYLVYDNGITFTLDDISPLEKNFEKLFSLGKNTFAYINSSQRLRVLYQNDFYGLDDAGTQTTFGAGQNIVAYTDRDGFNFRAFWKGNTYIVDANAPTKFQMANDMIALVDIAGNFKVFENGQTYTLNSYEPKEFSAVDSVVVLESSIGLFNAFYQGKVYLLDNIVPEKYEIANGHVAWLDRNKWLQVFHNGKVINVTKEEVTDITLDGNLVRFTAGANDTKIWWDGVLY